MKSHERVFTSSARCRRSPSGWGEAWRPTRFHSPRPWRGLWPRLCCYCPVLAPNRPMFWFFYCWVLPPGCCASRRCCSASCRRCPPRRCRSQSAASCPSVTWAERNGYKSADPHSGFPSVQAHGVGTTLPVSAVPEVRPGHTQALNISEILKFILKILSFW